MKPIKQIDVGNDPYWTLEEWLTFIQAQIATYGSKSILYTDAGANNVSLYINQVSKKKQLKE